MTRSLLLRIALTLSVAGCSPTSLRIHYDPTGTWLPLDEASWPGQEDYSRDVRPCSDEIGALMSEGPIQVIGTFPEWKGHPTDGELQIGELTIPVLLTHDTSGGSSAREAVEGFTFEDGTDYMSMKFYTDRTARVGTEFPGKDYCWWWFAQE